MMTKIATYIFIALFVVTLGASSVFYIYTFKPLEAKYNRMAAGLPELEKAKAELRKYKEKENKENQNNAWMSPVIDVMSSSLSDEIKAGKAEVLAAGNKVVVNISERALYLPASYTFSQESPQLRTKLIGLLHNKELKGKMIQIGNTTDAVPPQSKGRKKIPGKDARTLAAERSAALIKDFEKNGGVDQDVLIASAYSSKQPDIGFTIKGHKTVIIIESPPVVPAVAAKQEAAPAPHAPAGSTTATKSTSTVTAPVPASPQAQPKPIPLQPSQPGTK